MFTGFARLSENISFTWLVEIMATWQGQLATFKN